MFKPSSANKMVTGFMVLLTAGLICPFAVGKAQVPADGAPNDIEKQSLEKWGKKKAEGFALPSSDGKMVDVSADIGKKPVVLVFYRGVW